MFENPPSVSEWRKFPGAITINTNNDYSYTLVINPGTGGSAPSIHYQKTNTKSPLPNPPKSPSPTYKVGSSNK